jgi:peptidoglycan/LPS O-acetylase OafA/YrhL
MLLQPTARLHSLNALRGLAALAVVLWHWQHLQLPGTPTLTWSNEAGSLTHSHEPLPFILSLFYERGSISVDFFFLISGFIFFWLYPPRIADSSISTADFWLVAVGGPAARGRFCFSRGPEKGRLGWGRPDRTTSRHRSR